MSASSPPSPLYIGWAISFGVTSCIVSHRHTLRGDFLATAHILAYLILYIIFRTCTSAPYPAFAASVLSTVYVTTALSLTVAYRLSPWHPLASYPGPWYARVTTLWLSYVSSTGKRYVVLDRLHARYGAYLRIGPNHVSISSPSGTSIYINMEKSESYRHPGHNGAVALFFKQETTQAHRERRRVWSQLFTPVGLASLVPQMECRTWELLQCLDRRQREQGDYVDLPETMFHWAHDFMGDMVFGGSNAFEYMKNGDKRNDIHAGKVATALLDSIGLTPWLMDILWHVPLMQSMHRLARHATNMMHARKKATQVHAFHDLASYLLEEGLSEEELQTDAVVAIIGGSDNTSITVSIAIYFLLSNPVYYHQLRKELADAFPDPMALLRMSILASLPVLNGVINETLRLASPYYIPRVVPPGGTLIDGNYIPGGTVVALAAHSQQTDPENFSPHPLDFHPTRWQPQGLGPCTKTNKSLLASFSYGPHSCIGKPLAYQQMRLVLARLILTFDMELPPNFDVPGFRAGILNMRTMFLEQKLHVKVTRRANVNLGGADLLE